MELKKGALAAGVYFFFGVMALIYMRVSFGPPPPSAYLAVCVIPLGIMTFAFVSNRITSD